ncbi:MAG: SUMF1/EgtB/PvdO family nonheme iron enzyme [Bacteroidales bacterium]|nr:SUMF1/EgtB/PvdO family nonheme iron enzyme [Bacteroidales bacterium]
MKKFLLIITVLAVFSGCKNSGNGELIGVQGRPKFHERIPFGMSFIPLGSYTMGASDQDVPYSQVHHPKTVSVSSFFMDQSEITNNEYRQFVNWVRDSLAHTILAETNKGDEKLCHYLWDKQEGAPINANPNGEEPIYLIDWKKSISWDAIDKEGNKNPLEKMFLSERERFFRQRELDTRLFVYQYWEIDLKKASKAQNRFQYDSARMESISIIDIEDGGGLEWGSYSNGITDRSAFVYKKMTPIYPDTLCWIYDYTYSYNEPLTKSYFWHPAYDNYPIVGVNWNQAKAFSVWRSQMMKSYMQSMGEPMVNEFRLPTETEWEWAARGGLELSPYPWGGPYLRNKSGCILANFKPNRGNYAADGGNTTLIVGHFQENDWGLFDMSGNVAEWTDDAYNEASFYYSWDLNPSFYYNAATTDNPVLKRKVVRGGSWKDIAYYLQVSTRNYEYQDSSNCYTGFRNVQSYLGRQMSDSPSASSHIYK